MLKHLIQGLRILNAVPIDPLNIPLISIAKNNSFVPTLAFNYTDVTYEGWKDAVVLRSEINPKDNDFHMVIKIPRYVMRCLYDVTGSIVGIPLEGSGNLTLIFYNLTNDMHLRGHQNVRNGQEFLVIDDFVQKSLMDQVHFNLSNVFNDAKRTEITNRLLNSNSKAVVQAGIGIIDHVWGRIHGGLMQKIFDKVPYRAMFPDVDTAPTAVDDKDEEER
ncbi:Takeout, isoform B [Gryllus bimaculatus]|nr:Takeout, isoform B [Gryllus bimaculatus]